MRFFPLNLAAPVLMLLAAPAFAQDLSSISIMTAIENATARFSGDVVAADLAKGRENEPEAVYSLRLLTPNGDVIEIRIDAETGAIIEASGRGLVDARKPPRQF